MNPKPAGEESEPGVLTDLRKAVGGPVSCAGIVFNNARAGSVLAIGVNALTMSGPVSGPWKLTKAGAGILAISNANTFSGGLVMSLGTLNLRSPTSVGSGTFTINGGTVDNSSGAALTLTNNNLQSWEGSFVFAVFFLVSHGVGGIEQRDEVGVPGASFDYRELSAAGLAAGRIVGNVSVGARVRYLYEKLYTEHANGVGVDVGAVYSPTPVLTVGVSALNLGSHLWWSTAAIRFSPRRIWALTCPF